MKLPNWAKIIWWLAITGSLTYFLRARLPALLTGNGNAADIAVFGVWMALLLAPLFSEVTLLGITLKNELQELKSTVATQLYEIRSEVRNAVDVRATFSPQFHIPAPVPDAQLPQLEERIKAAVASALNAQGVKEEPKQPALAVDDDVAFLFAIRYHIETELRRLAARGIVARAMRKHLPTQRLLRELTETEIVPQDLGSAIREVYAVCSPAIHGEDVSEAQLEFVKDVGPQLVATLRALQ